MQRGAVAILERRGGLAHWTPPDAGRCRRPGLCAQASLRVARRPGVLLGRLQLAGPAFRGGAGRLHLGLAASTSALARLSRALLRIVALPGPTPRAGRRHRGPRQPASSSFVPRWRAGRRARLEGRRVGAVPLAGPAGRKTAWASLGPGPGPSWMARARHKRPAQPRGVPTAMLGRQQPPRGAGFAAAARAPTCRRSPPVKRPSDRAPSDSPRCCHAATPPPPLAFPAPAWWLRPPRPDRLPPPP